MSSRACLDRRVAIAGGAALLSLFRGNAWANAQESNRFAAEAIRQRDLAIASGDQPYGAVIVLDGNIVGFGPSRVVAERNNDAHAERVALRDAQRRLGRAELAGAVIYATSRPCMVCQPLLARAGIIAMHVGAEGTHVGPPSGGP